MNLDIIRFEDVSVSYGPLVALDHVKAEISCSSLAAIVGPNGAGKSTLLRAILGWHPLKGGRILLGDDHIQHQRPRLAYVPQKIRVDWDFPATVRMIVEQGRFPTLGNWRRFTAQDHEIVGRALAEMGLEEIQDRQIGRLSGGQQQKVFLARALAQGGDIFLLDEPFEGLDAVAAQTLIDMLQSWVRQHRTVLAAIHDITMVRQCFSHAMLLNRRVIACGRVHDVLTAENFERAYGHPLPGERAPFEVVHSHD